ncbi:discoidin domain-containing protein [Paenibacillus sp. BR2-3]|uniref:discoidin domain-containing protein n=1 Tax=Paenibacillus sp. BR2-3 TaxID=3048494 RepID=UPI003977D3BA
MKKKQLLYSMLIVIFFLLILRERWCLLVKSRKVIYLIMFLLLINTNLANAESYDGVTYYQIGPENNRLKYIITPSNNVIYYLYDSNGNIIKKITSKNFPAFTSSSLVGWEAYRLGDSSGTAWSSEAHGTENTVEWAALDVGGHHIIGEISLTPRATLAFPKDFKIQSSNDGITWTDIPGQKYSNYVNNGSVQTFKFGSSVMARYVRVYATKLSKDDMGNYYFQLAEFNAKLTIVATSSNIKGWEAVKLSDNNSTTVWSSEWHASEASTEWITLYLDSIEFVSGISLTPRGTLSFPKEFNIQSSVDGIIWTDIPGQAYTNYINDGSVKTFSFGNPVITRYLRVYATKLGKDDMGGYYFQLADFQANLVNAAASSALNGWGVVKLTDNNPSTVWSSEPRANEATTEWIALNLESIKSISGINLTPRATLSFPKDFKIQSSKDGLTWTDIPEQAYSSYVNNGSVQTFNFGTPVMARYVRVYATKLGKDDMGGYYFQLAEFKANLSNVAVLPYLKVDEGKNQKVAP